MRVSPGRGGAAEDMDNSWYLLALFVLLLSLGCRIEQATCQHYYLLRPVPSDTLPIVELEEHPDPVLDPHR